MLDRLDKGDLTNRLLFLLQSVVALALMLLPHR
jgi:hypothetical protein